MPVALWVVQGLLALGFLFSGLMKVSQPLAALGERMHWVKTFPPAGVRAIGGVEILAAIGLILPGLLKIAPVLTPLAASGLVITMIGAVVVHLRLKEAAMSTPAIVLLLLSAFVAWGRFGPCPLP